MTRYLIDVYKIDIPSNAKIRDDLAETTEDFLNRTRDFQFQIQGKSIQEIIDRLERLKPKGVEV